MHLPPQLLPAGPPYTCRETSAPAQLLPRCPSETSPQPLPRLGSGEVLLRNRSLSPGDRWPGPRMLAWPGEGRPGPRCTVMGLPRCPAISLLVTISPQSSDLQRIWLHRCTSKYQTKRHSMVRSKGKQHLGKRQPCCAGGCGQSPEAGREHSITENPSLSVEGSRNWRKTALDSFLCVCHGD